MLKKMGIQNKMFFLYSFIVILTISITAFTFSTYYKKTIYNYLKQAFMEEADSLLKQVDNTVFVSDRLSLQIQYNLVIVKAFHSVTLSENPLDYFEDNYEMKNEVINMMTSIIGIDPQVYNRVIIVNRTGAFASIGAVYDESLTHSGILELDWFDKLDKNNVYRLFLPPHKDYWDYNGVEVVSVVRKVQNTGFLHSLVEIQIPCKYFEKLINNNLEGSGEDKIIYITDDMGNIIYPYKTQPDNNDMDIIRKFSEEYDLTGESFFDYQAQNGKNIFGIIKEAEHTGWNIIILRDRNNFFKPVRVITYIIFIMGGVLALISILLVFTSAKKLIKPLKHLADSMNSITIDYLQCNPVADDTHNEVVILSNSFNDMLTRLKETRQVAIEAKSRELKACFAALQAQVNPHFLCNTLSLIGMMGREDGKEDILNICSDLSGMFRYIISLPEQSVTVKDELIHTVNYLKIIKVRYGECINYSIDIDQSLYEIRMPKLVLQPLAENSVKHGFANKRPPWNIEIKGYVDKDSWKIYVMDNGCGFDEEFLNDIEKKKEEVARLLSQGDMIGGNSNWDGIGILNTYARLYLQFTGNVIFEIGNTKIGGYVCVGSKLL